MKKTLLVLFLLSTLTFCFAQEQFFSTDNSVLQSHQARFGELQSRLVTVNPSFTEKLPDKANFNFQLFDDVSFQVKLKKDQSPKYMGMQVWKGSTASASHYRHENYRNTIVVYNPLTGKMTGMLGENGRNFVFLPYGENNTYRIIEYQGELSECGALSAKLTVENNTGVSCGYCNETDENGDAVLDMFIGFSDDAAAVAGDLNAYGLMVVEDVNIGLTNSAIAGIYMRLVGTGTTPNNPGVVTSVLSDAWDWFAPEIEATGADFISVFQTFTGAANEAGGWAGVPGRSSVNGVTLPSAFRHEVGHNVGAAHCPGDGGVLPYAHGYNNGNWTTHMCGNDENYYSNPNILDNLGNPLGDAATADMARVWVERAGLITGHAIHRIPYYPGDISVDFDGDNICGSIDCDDNDSAVTFGCSTGPYSELVNNVDTIHSAGAPGSLYLTSISSIPLVSNPFASSCPSLFVAGGKYGAGHFIAVGHDGFIGDGAVNNFDNPTFLKNAFNWMNNGGNKVVKMTSGHSEWVNFSNTPQFQNIIGQDGFLTSNLSGTISNAALVGVDILVIGNAWGTMTATEIDAIHNFVNNGGGLFMLGLGWSYEYYVGPLQNFAMNQIASPMGVEWITGTINDPVNQFNGSPLFTYFHPYISMRSPCDIAPPTFCHEDEISVHQVDEPLYQAMNILYSDAEVRCDATFKAYDCIKLEAGFKVLENVNFSAVNAACPQ